MSVTSPRGFRASGISAGLKSNAKADLALVVNDGPLRVAAGVFTTNRFQAAPVMWSRQVVGDGRVDAVLLNSGGANACTGPDGFADTHTSAERVAELLRVSATDVAICSTGLIGARLPMTKILAGISDAVSRLAHDGGAIAAEAIMTTDTVPKTATRQGGGVTVGGMAKGAGMLAPELATMLVVLTTDAEIDSATCDRVLRRAVAQTFDRVDSDGCQSTNDTVLLLASGASGVMLSEDDLAHLVTDVALDLARQLIADAEGASKEVEISVVNAVTVDDALEVARACARSNLLKCALHGQDPNWGRILSAAGTTSAEFEADRVNVMLNGVMIARAGAIGDDRSLVDMTGRRVEIIIDLNAGDHSGTVWTNDLTAAYVHENSEYAT
jgi:glutamate N-acetyltransferase / amino-acid N-acetyltransferase